MKWYHGTSAQNAEKVLAEGVLKPGQDSIYDVDVPRYDAVYVTSEYQIAKYYAEERGKDGKVFEVDVNISNLLPDEDSIYDALHSGAVVMGTKKNTKLGQAIRQAWLKHWKSIGGEGNTFEEAWELWGEVEAEGSSGIAEEMKDLTEEIHRENPALSKAIIEASGKAAHIGPAKIKGLAKGQTAAKKIELIKTPGFVIEVPQERRKKFFVRPKSPLEYWAFKNRPRVFVNEQIIFTFNGKPVAESVVVKVEPPGHGEGEHKQWHKVYWKPSRFRKFRVTAATNRKFYHGTKTKNLDDILKNGLRVDKSEAHTEWHHAVYLACDAYTAANYEGMHGNGEPWTILEIDGKKLREEYMRPDDYDFPDLWNEEHDENWAHQSWQTSLKVSCQIAYLADIPPAAIKVHPYKKDNTAVVDTQKQFLDSHTVEQVAEHFGITIDQAAKAKSVGKVTTASGKHAAEDEDYYMVEGCGIYAVELARKNGGEIYVMSADRGEEWSEEIPYEVTHAFVKKDGKTYDIRGERTPDKMAWELSMGNYSIKGPWTPDAFEAKFMGSGDDKPLFGKDASKKTADKIIDVGDGDEYWAGEGNGASGILPVCPQKGTVCLAWRSQYVMSPHCWGTIGGAIQQGKSPQQSAKAELQEETGFTGGISLIPAYVFTDRGFSYHNFIGVTSTEFPFAPKPLAKEQVEEFKRTHPREMWYQTITGWETDNIEWVPYATVIDDMNENPEDYHPGLLKLFKNSKDAIERALGIKDEGEPTDGKTAKGVSPTAPVPDASRRPCPSGKKKFFDASSVLHNFQNLPIPPRAYMCPMCGWFHLTSKPQKNAAGEQGHLFPSSQDARFREWFNGSKVVDKAGRPMPVYHGTRSSVEFDEFAVDGPPQVEDSYEGETTSSGSGADPTAFIGAHFAEEANVANQFAQGTGWTKSRYEGEAEKPRVIQVFLRITNPKDFGGEENLRSFIYQGKASGDVLDIGCRVMTGYNPWEGEDDEDGEIQKQIEAYFQKYENDQSYRAEQNRMLLEDYRPMDMEDEQLRDMAYELAMQARGRLEAAGHDGVRYKNIVEGGHAWIAFAANQIKSAWSNFTPNDPRFTASVKEAAPLHDEAKNRTYYHGTDDEAAAQAILSGGIQPREITMPTEAKSRAMQAPVPDRVYLTDSIDYAAIYAMGGQSFGMGLSDQTKTNYTAEMWLKNHTENGQYGYIFEVRGADLTGDVMPDEDSIGEALAWIISYNKDTRRLQELKTQPERYKGEKDGLKRSMEIIMEQPIVSAPEAIRNSLYYMKEFLTSNQLHRIDEAAVQAQVGKKLQKRLAPQVAKWLLDNGAHMAHQGPVFPTRAWRFSKKDALYTKDWKSILQEVPMATSKAAAGFQPWMKPWLTGKCWEFAIALSQQMSGATFVGLAYQPSGVIHHVGLKKGDKYYDVRGEMGADDFNYGTDQGDEIVPMTYEEVLTEGEFGSWIGHEDEFNQTSEMKEATKAVRRAFGKTAAAHTPEYAQKLIETLKQTVHGADFKVIGSVGSGQSSENDLDILVTVHSDAVLDDDNPWVESSGLVGAMNLLGFDYLGPSDFTPEESADKSETSGKYLDPQGSGIEKFFNSNTMHTVEFWFTDMPEPGMKEADWKSKLVLPTALALGLGAPSVAPTSHEPVPISTPAVQEKQVSLDELVEAIRRAEGADPDLHNPGNLVGFHSGEIMQFETDAQGVHALKNALKRIADGKNPNFSPDVTLEQAGKIYANGDPNWAKNISQILGVDPQTSFVKLIKGKAKVASADLQWLKKAAGFAFRSFKKLWHVGSMNPKQKRNDSYEGAGLSVSVNPEEWQQIAKIGGDLWELTKPGNKFVNYWRISAAQKKAIMNWGVKNGFAEPAEIWRHSYQMESEYNESDEPEERYSDYETEAEARAELGGYGGDEKVEKVKGGVKATAKLAQRTMRDQKYISPSEVYDLVVTVYAEDELECDGVWWADTLDPANLSAPRGVIFPSKLQSWKKRKVQRSASKQADMEQYLYHGTNNERLPSILKNGMPAGSFWGTEDMAFWFSKGASEEEGLPVVLRLPLSRFNQSALAVDNVAIQEPITEAIGRDEEELYAEWEAVPGEGTWQDSLRIYHSVKYNAPIKIEQKDVWYDNSKAASMAVKQNL